MCVATNLEKRGPRYSSAGVAGLEDGVQQVFGNDKAFVALKAGGEVVVWGDPEAGPCASQQVS